ncbi:hypothetical protein KP509_1Z040600 [Ceratopteris richardii]|nr:hypothetical protein KP509_1Z040600 [Ceratopteris richardii]
MAAFSPEYADMEIVKQKGLSPDLQSLSISLWNVQSNEYILPRQLRKRQEHFHGREVKTKVNADRAYSPELKLIRSYVQWRAHPLRYYRILSGW